MVISAAAYAWVAVLAFAGPKLQLPWKCGKVESCTQGHGSGSHTGNSNHAWDFVLQEGDEIWAASAGVVTHRRMSSDSGGCNSAFATEGNYITIDHGDGTSIIYAHMAYQSSPLKVGDQVEVGDYLARVGQTGYVCGAHLHMAVQNQCSSSHCASVSASFKQIGDPSAGQSLESLNCPACTKTLDGGQTLIQEEDAGCLQRRTNAWFSVNNGHEGHHFYAQGTDADQDDTRALWVFGVDAPGDYEVEVFIPDQAANTTNARYVVRHADGSDEVFLDQSANKGWQSLGVYPFLGGEDEAIKLGDMTGENTPTPRKIGFDSVRFTFVPSAAGDDTGSDPEPPPDDDPPESGTDSSDGGDPPADPPADPDTTSDDAGTTGSGDGSGDGDGDGGTTGNGDGDGGTSEALPNGFGGVPEDGGCQCNEGGDPDPIAALLMFGLLGARVRRQ